MGDDYNYTYRELNAASISSDVNTPSDVDSLRELWSEAEIWLANARHILGEEEGYIKKMTAWVATLNDESRKTVFPNSHLGAFLERNFSLADFFIRMIFDLGKSKNLEWAHHFRRKASTQLLDVIGSHSRFPQNVIYEGTDLEDGPVYVTTTFDEIKSYFAKHPEKLYSYNDRKFEELVCDILRDMGFDSQLTKKSRDGGRDILAYMRNAVTSFLMFVECKRWKAEDKVGIDIVQRLHGTCVINGADKGMIVTTSFFTDPAIEERQKVANKMELTDFDALKEWLGRYK